MFLRNIFIFYIMLFGPFLVIALLTWVGIITSGILMIVLPVFLFIYHPTVCGFRLLSLNKIKRSEFFYNFIPGWNLPFFLILFFNKK